MSMTRVFLVESVIFAIFPRLSATRYLDKTEGIPVFFSRSSWSCVRSFSSQVRSFEQRDSLDLRLGNRKRKMSCEKTGHLRFHVGRRRRRDKDMWIMYRYSTTLSPADLEDLENLRVERTILVRLGDTDNFLLVYLANASFLNAILHRDLFQ